MIPKIPFNTSIAQGNIQVFDKTILTSLPLPQPWISWFDLLVQSINSPILPIVTTANLPAVDSRMKGKILIEDAGAGAYNLVIYSDISRRRFTGTNI